MKCSSHHLKKKKMSWLKMHSPNILLCLFSELGVKTVEFQLAHEEVLWECVGMWLSCHFKEEKVEDVPTGAAQLFFSMSTRDRWHSQAQHASPSPGVPRLTAATPSFSLPLRKAHWNKRDQERGVCWGNVWICCNCFKTKSFTNFGVS